jgi:hypothetical protein
MMHAGVSEAELAWSTAWEAGASHDQDDDGSYPFDEYEYEDGEGEEDYGLWDSEMRAVAARVPDAR